MTIEHEVAQHYGRGGLEQLILDGLRKLGRPTDPIDPDDLSEPGADEFHIGGHQATLELGQALDLKRGTALLDIGCGIGGAARTFARNFGCKVVGIDLTPEFVAVGNSLNRRTGLETQVDLQVASALDIPFADGSFDVATQLHVGMNIADKGRLAHEAARLLRPGGSYAIYDVMRVGDGEPSYPMPWAATPETSFVATPQQYREALEGAGFHIVSERARTALAKEFFARGRARWQELGGPPPLGSHLIMGPEARTRLGNIAAAIEAGILAPVELISHL